MHMKNWRKMTLYKMVDKYKIAKSRNIFLGITA